jgi:RNA polymerase sigma factor (sigma-70 family)
VYKKARGGATLDDQALAANARRGDVGAFEELIRRHQEIAFRTAYLVLRDAAAAEDAAQEAMVKAYRAIGRFREGGSFRPWLLKIVSNQALTVARSRIRHNAAIERASAEPQAFLDVDETVIDRERSRLIWSALQSLNERERLAVYLRYFLGLPERELAEYLGVPPGTVKSRLHRALEHLRKIIATDWPQLVEEHAT